MYVSPLTASKASHFPGQQMADNAPSTTLAGAAVGFRPTPSAFQPVVPSRPSQSPPLGTPPRQHRLRGQQDRDRDSSPVNSSGSELDDSEVSSQRRPVLRRPIDGDEADEEGDDGDEAESGRSRRLGDASDEGGERNAFAWPTHVADDERRFVVYYF